MRSTHILVAGILLMAATSTRAADPNDRAWFEPARRPLLHVQTGKYHVAFTEKASWTLYAAWHDGNDMLTPSGAYQSVVNFKKVPEGVDQFIGSGHRPETISSLVLEIDGRDVDLADPNKVKFPIPGKVFVLKKHSLLGPYRHTSAVRVDPDGIREDYTYELVGDLDNVKLMYPFMHCFSKAMSIWRAQPPEGEAVEANFLSDGTFVYNKAAKWLSVYSPAWQKGVLLVYPHDEPAPNKFWNRTRDGKLYLTVIPSNMPKRFEKSIVVRSFEADPQSWRVHLSKLAQQIKK